MSSNPTVPVSFFNANTSSINVVVNNGTQFTVNGAASPTYAPGVNTTGVTFAVTIGPGVLGVGNNQVEITPVGATQTQTYYINIPSSGPMNSVQVYMFWSTATTAGWVVCNEGQVIAMNTNPATSPSAAAAARRR